MERIFNQALMEDLLDDFTREMVRSKVLVLRNTQIRLITDLARKVMENKVVDVKDTILDPRNAGVYERIKELEGKLENAKTLIQRLYVEAESVKKQGGALSPTYIMDLIDKWKDPISDPVQKIPTRDTVDKIVDDYFECHKQANTSLDNMLTKGEDPSPKKEVKKESKCILHKSMKTGESQFDEAGQKLKPQVPKPYQPCEVDENCIKPCDRYNCEGKMWLLNVVDLEGTLRGTIWHCQACGHTKISYHH